MLDQADLENILKSMTALKAGARNSAADTQRLKQIMTLCQELLGSEQQEDQEEAAEAAGGEGDMPMGSKAISKREDVNPKEGVHAYGNVAFADEKNKKYPIDTVEHIRAAWNYINKSENAGKYDASEVAQIKRKIVAAWKEKIDKAGPPSAEGKSAMNLSYAKSLGLSLPDEDLIQALAVKRVTANVIMGHLTLYGDPDHTDVEREFFDANTDHWLDKITLPVPLTYDHAQDHKTASAPVIGQITDWGKDDVGVWYAAQLDRSHKYRAAIDGLIEHQGLGTSSDSAPQYITRQKAKSGATYLARWPLFAAALTPTPAEPRMFDTVDYFKSIGVRLPLDPDAPVLTTVRPDQARAEQDAAARLLEILKFSIRNV